MKLREDTNRFDELQLFITDEIVSAAKHHLEEAGLTGEKLYDATSAIAFAFAATIDGSAIMTHKNKRVLPVLTFADPDDPDTLIGAGGSWMHEYVVGFVDDAFGI